jgi:hypothetical protein
MKLLRTILGFDKPAGKPGAFLHDLFVVLAFCALTAALTWPYVNYLRDVVADPGDPYLVSWILWWDYHQTFKDPLNLFHANLFYPLRYTLAFSEHCYGIAFLFFPLFALGFRPLTVHAVAMFLGFALCGYSAFRLARTLTGSQAAAWVTGIVFAFVPFRFHLLSHLPYLFTLWIPLLLEALVLFVRERSRKRAFWLGFAFFMNGITSVSLFSLTLVPAALCGVVLLTRHGLWRDRQFWRRGAVALGVASIALLPFMLPYYFVSKIYGFRRSIEEVKANSAWPIHWLSVENRNKLWNRMGEGITGGAQFKLFPGLLPILFSLAAMFAVNPPEQNISTPEDSLARREGPGKWLSRLDAIILFTFALSIPAIGFDGTDAFSNFFYYVSSARVLAILTAAVIARCCISYPSFLRPTRRNLIETLRSESRSDAFWMGIILTIVGFCYSLGWNFFFYRICYDLLPMFRSMRVPTRGAMFAYLGLAILAGLGVQQLALRIGERRPRLRPAMLFTVACALLLVELNGAPLKMTRGDVFPDAVSLRLKETSMRGGLVVLPAGADFNHRHILRSADHQKPLIVGTSGFNSPYEDQIEAWTSAGDIHDPLLELLEKIPTSYLVIENHLIVPERRADYEAFLVRAIRAGRLRFVNRFDGRDDLYAVVKTEPEAKTEAPLPFAIELKDWQQLIEENPVNVLGKNRAWSQIAYRLQLASFGEMPRYSEFMSDLKQIGRGALVNSENEQTQLEVNMNQFVADWVKRSSFQTRYQSTTSERFVDALSENAGIVLAPGERSSLIDKLNGGAMTRGEALLAIVKNPEFAKREENRSLLLLHYFGYLRRNPGESPDKDMEGFTYWLRELEKTRRVDRLAAAFMESIEYKGKNGQQ